MLLTLALRLTSTYYHSLSHSHSHSLSLTLVTVLQLIPAAVILVKIIRRGGCKTNACVLLCLTLAVVHPTCKTTAEYLSWTNTNTTIPRGTLNLHDLEQNSNTVIKNTSTHTPPLQVVCNPSLVLLRTPHRPVKFALWLLAPPTLCCAEYEPCNPTVGGPGGRRCPIALRLRYKPHCSSRKYSLLLLHECYPNYTYTRASFLLQSQLHILRTFLPLQRCPVTPPNRSHPASYLANTGSAPACHGLARHPVPCRTRPLATSMRSPAPDGRAAAAPCFSTPIARHH